MVYCSKIANLGKVDNSRRKFAPIIGSKLLSQQFLLIVEAHNIGRYWTSWILLLPQYASQPDKPNINNTNISAVHTTHIKSKLTQQYACIHLRLTEENTEKIFQK